MEDKEKVGIHKINLIDRKNLNITGVIKVISSNSNIAVLKLKESNLEIHGCNLSIESFCDNIINLEGNIDSLKYSKQFKVKENFFKRIFK